MSNPKDGCRGIEALLPERALARALGGDAVGSNRVLAPGPGHSPRDRSLSVLIDPNAPNGFLVTSFSGDDWRDCRDHVLGLLGKSVSHTSPSDRRNINAPGNRPGHATVPKAAATHALAARLWGVALPFVDSPAATYLAMRIPLLAKIDFDRSALRFHPACPFRLQDAGLIRLPAMLAAMVDIATNEFCGIHRTALKLDGTGKSAHPGLGNPKRMLGLAAGACVKLSPDEVVTTGLHLAEGIETALACMAMGFAPVWAALSAGAIERFPVLGGVEALTVFADNDANGAGLASARACAGRWSQAGNEVRVAWPPAVGRDWADDVETGL